MIGVILIFGCLFIGFYSVLAILFKLPKWGAVIYKQEKEKKKIGFLQNAAKIAAPHIPLNKIKEAELQKQLKAARLEETPREFVAQLWLSTGFFVLLAVLLGIIQPFLAVVPSAIALFAYFRKKEQIDIKIKKRTQEIEKATPRFVSYASNRLRTEHNMINIIDDFNSNESGALSEELAITVADMRTGNQEQAIERFQERIHSPIITELCRGMLSAMRGEDVTVYFENLNKKLIALWGQRLRLQLLKKEPKISRMSMILVGCSLVSTVVVLLVFVLQALTTMGV